MALDTVNQKITPRLLTGLTALGSSQATGFACVNGAAHEFTTVAGSTAATLPVAILPSEISIFNASTTTLTVYPPLGGTIDGGSVNASVTVATLVGVTYWAAGPLTWHSVATGGSGGGGSGTVTSVSVVSAHGLAGTVATATSTPAITLSTSVTGIVKGDGTSLSAAAYTDFPTIADKAVLGNTTGGTAAPAGVTLSAMIDEAIGSTQGDVLYRGASAWGVLAPGTAGQQLVTNGAAANPAWASTGLLITQSLHVIPAPAFATPIPIDLSTGDMFAPVALTANTTLTLTNAPASSPWARAFMVVILQDGTGSRLVTTWFTGFTVLWAGGSAPILTTTGGKRDAFMFVQLSATTLMGFVVGQNI